MDPEPLSKPLRTEDVARTRYKGSNRVVIDGRVDLDLNSAAGCGFGHRLESGESFEAARDLTRLKRAAPRAAEAIATLLDDFRSGN